MEEAMPDDDKEKETATLGPFNDEEIENATRAAVVAMGRDWDRLKSGDKIGFVSETKEVLSGRHVSSDFAELVPGTTAAVENQFKTLVLQEFRNSPKWDEKEFKAGYGKPAAIAEGAPDAGSEATQ
jgi:hypothetical protein